MLLRVLLPNVCSVVGLFVGNRLRDVDVAEADDDDDVEGLRGGIPATRPTGF